jgi:RecJ-like exonuclease|tara:strand:- start:182 stop:331 length:150 start_codon:yes stop_codon:yes gene_type:complete
MKSICPECHGNGYVTVAEDEYDECPKCSSQGEIDEEVVEARETQRELGE